MSAKNILTTSDYRNLHFLDWNTHFWAESCIFAQIEKRAQFLTRQAGRLKSDPPSARVLIYPHKQARLTSAATLPSRRPRDKPPGMGRPEEAPAPEACSLLKQTGRRHDGRSAKFQQNVARFRLYRRRSLQENMRFAAFFKIYQII